MVDSHDRFGYFRKNHQHSKDVQLLHISSPETRDVVRAHGYKTFEKKKKMKMMKIERAIKLLKNRGKVHIKASGDTRDSASILQRYLGTRKGTSRLEEGALDKVVEESGDYSPFITKQGSLMSEFGQ